MVGTIDTISPEYPNKNKHRSYFEDLVDRIQKKQLGSGDFFRESLWGDPKFKGINPEDFYDPNTGTYNLDQAAINKLIQENFAAQFNAGKENKAVYDQWGALANQALQDSNNVNMYNLLADQSGQAYNDMVGNLRGYVGDYANQLADQTRLQTGAVAAGLRGPTNSASLRSLGSTASGAYGAANAATLQNSLAEQEALNVMKAKALENIYSQGNKRFTQGLGYDAQKNAISKGYYDLGLADYGIGIDAKKQRMNELIRNYAKTHNTDINQGIYPEENIGMKMLAGTTNAIADLFSLYSAAKKQQEGKGG